MPRRSLHRLAQARFVAALIACATLLAAADAPALLVAARGGMSATEPSAMIAACLGDECGPDHAATPRLESDCCAPSGEADSAGCADHDHGDDHDCGGACRCDCHRTPLAPVEPAIRAISLIATDGAPAPAADEAPEGPSASIDQPPKLSRR